MLMTFVRFTMFVFIGASGALAWQSYGGAAREKVASWSPYLASWVPPAAPAGDSPEQIVAISRDLAVVRQSVDKLAADITKLQAPQQGAARTSVSPHSAAGVRKPSRETR